MKWIDKVDIKDKAYFQGLIVMSEHASVNQVEKIVRAGLRAAAEKGWAALSFTDIADEAGVSLSDLRLVISEKLDLLDRFAQIVDRRVLDDVHHLYAPNDSVRDKLFSILMGRFDVLQDDRAGVCAVLRDVLKDPCDAITSLPHIIKSMRWMAESAGMRLSGIKGAGVLIALSGLYIWVLRTWVQDESSDMSTTMAALDHRLSQAQRWGLID